MSVNNYTKALGGDSLRANSGLKLNEISEPILGLIFLKFADVRFKNSSGDCCRPKRRLFYFCVRLLAQMIINQRVFIFTGIASILIS